MSHVFCIREQSVSYLVYLAAEPSIAGHPWGGRHVTLCGHNYGIASRAVAEAMARAALSRVLPSGAWHLNEARHVDVRLGGQGMCVFVAY